MFGITRWTGVTNQQAEMTKAAQKPNEDENNDQKLTLQIVLHGRHTNFYAPGIKK